jgi:hypothetical protein
MRERLQHLVARLEARIGQAELEELLEAIVQRYENCEERRETAVLVACLHVYEGQHARTFWNPGMRSGRGQRYISGRRRGLITGRRG